jgi:hypothetical protein
MLHASCDLRNGFTFISNHRIKCGYYKFTRTVMKLLMWLNFVIYHKWVTHFHKPMYSTWNELFHVLRTRSAIYKISKITYCKASHTKVHKFHSNMDDTQRWHTKFNGRVFWTHQIRWAFLLTRQRAIGTYSLFVILPPTRVQSSVLT